MALELEPLMVKLLGDASVFRAMASQATASLQALGGQVASQARALGGIQARLDNMGGSFGSFATGLAATAAGVLGITSSFDILRDSISLAAEAEQNEIAFGTMLQSAQLGKQMVEDLQAFAAATPMDTSTLQMAAKTLLQFGVAGDDILPTLQMLGDATGGNAERMRMMALSFGQMSGAGRLMGQDLLQMINAGFNPLMQMSKTTGKSIGDLKKEMEQGRISVDMVKQAFKDATGPGGMFAGLMEKQSKSLGGLFSTMQDDVDAFKRTLGKELIEGLNLKGLVQLVSMAAQAFTGWFQGLDKNTKSILFLIPVGIVAVSTAMLGAVVAAKLLSLGIGFVTGAMAFLKITTLLNVAAWVAWTAASVLANGAVLLLKAGVWLLNAALTATNVLLAGLYLSLLVIAGLGIASAFIVLAGAVWGVYQAGKGVFELFSDFPTTTGPLAAITGLFGEWWTALKNVAATARTDLPLAWEMFQIELAVAIAKVQALWPPLWEFIKTGFDATFTLAATLFENAFLQAIATILGQISQFPSVFGASSAGMAMAIEQLNQSVEKSNQAAKDAAKGQMAAALANFKVDETDAVKQAKEQAQAWWDFFGEEEPEESIWTRLVAGIGPEMAKGGAAAEGMQQKVKALKDEFKGIEAVAFGGAEALTRTAAYQQLLGKTAGGKVEAAVQRFDVAQVGGAEAQGREANQMDIWKQMRDLLQKQVDKPTAEVADADLG